MGLYMSLLLCSIDLSVVGGGGGLSSLRGGYFFGQLPKTLLVLLCSSLGERLEVSSCFPLRVS